MRSILPAATYASMIAVPMFLFLYSLSVIFGYGYIQTLLEALLGISLLVFSISNGIEIYVDKKSTSNVLSTSRKKFYDKTADATHATSKEHKKSTKVVTFNVKKFNPSKKDLEVHTYKVEVDKFTSVLTALLKIKAHSDNKLSVRCSCNMGICGSCGMEVNGKPVLACETNVLKNIEDGDQLTISPMTGHPLLKDLVTDFDDFFAKHISVDPFLERKNKKEQYAAKEFYDQGKEEIDKFLPYSYCIMCGLCLDACPVVNTNPAFIGPQALSQEYRYYKDSRDQMGTKRIDLINHPEMVWACEFAGSCSDACPKGVDPAGAIQLLKFEAMKNNLFGKDVIK